MLLSTTIDLLDYLKRIFNVNEGKESGISGSLTRKLAELEHERIWKSVQHLGASQFKGR